MSFFTALTGLKGAQTDISTTSNNIANVGSAGFKKSRAEFGDIFSTTPLQTNLTGSGTQQKSITQQFSQGNIQQSTNTLDMAVSGQGFFALKAGGNTGQTVYTRNGAFNLNDDGYIIDSNGQFLLGYPVDSDGAVTDTTLNGAVKLQVQTDYGDPKETNNVVKGVNLPAGAPVIASNVSLMLMILKHFLRLLRLQFLTIWVTLSLQLFSILKLRTQLVLIRHINTIRRCLLMVLKSYHN